MNILFVAHHDNYQGSSRSLMSLLEGLIDLGITPFVVIPRESEFTEALKAKGISYRILPIPWWMTSNNIPLNKKWKLIRDIQKSAKSIGHLINKYEIDLVYTNSSVTPVGRLAARREHIPHIWHIREFSDLHFSFRYLFSKRLTMAYVKSSDAVICHAKAIRDHYFKIGTPNVHQVYNGCATREQFDERLHYRNATRPNTKFVFSMLSTITPKKGQEAAIRALAALRNNGLAARLLIAGSGKPDYLEHLHRLVKDLQIEDIVEFTGFVEDPFPLYFASDCALICSEHEALSRVGLEAMSTALPLIGRNSGGNPEIIVPGETGYLYDTFDDLVESMTRLVQDPALGRQMGLAGWQRAKEMFNIEDYAANVYKVIQSVTNK